MADTAGSGEHASGGQTGEPVARLAFRALNAAEVIWAVAVAAALAATPPPAKAIIATAAAIMMLIAQLLLIRPGLARRSDAVLAGQDARAHMPITPTSP